MAKEVQEEVQRWTAKRRATLVLSIFKGETSVVEGARKHAPQYVIIALLFLCSCSTMYLPDYPVKPFNQYQFSASNDRLHVAVHPIANSSDSKKYFGVNFLDDDILPILITIENRNDLSSFLVEKEKFALSDSKSMSGEDSEIDKYGDTTTASTAGTVGAFGILVTPASAVVALTALRAYSNQSEIKRNFAEKELRAKTLSPNSSIYGFVFFKLPKDYRNDDQLLLRMPFLNISNKQVNELVVSFSME